MKAKLLVDGLRAGSRWIAIIAGLLVLFSAVLITIDVFGRLFANRVLVQSFEASRYLFAVAVAGSFALAAIDKTHIRIDIIVRLLDVRWRAILGVIAMGSLSVVAAYFAWRGYTVAAMSAQIGARPISGLPVPLWIPQAGWVLGLTWFAIVAGLLTLVGVGLLLTKQWEEADEMLGTPSVEEEIDLASDVNRSDSRAEASQ